MREGIHPKWYPEAQITCASCGTVWSMGSTTPQIRVDICAVCHPFYTGEQRIVDTEGMVDKFLNRLQQRDRRIADQRAKVEAKQNADIPLDALDLGKRYIKILNEAGIELVSDLIRKLDEEGGEESILSLPGIGVKVLADAKRRISEMGYQVKK